MAIETSLREALAELVAAKDAQEACRKLAARYYMPDSYLRADNQLESAWEAARAALSSKEEPESKEPK